MLQDTVERLFVQNLYADIERGLFLVRGENVLLLGEIVRETRLHTVLCQWRLLTVSQDLDKDDYIPEPFEQASAEKVFQLKKQEEQDRKKSDKIRQKRLAEFGFEGENSGEIIF